MAGGNLPKGYSHKPSSSSAASSHHRKSRWESGKNPPKDPKSGDPKTSKPSSNPSPKPPRPGPSPSPSNSKHPSAAADQIPPPSIPTANPSPRVPFPFTDPAAALGPPPPPAYGFHMLERRTIFLSDGIVRSYFALPPDYQDFPPIPRHLDPAGRFPPIGPGGEGHGLGGFDNRFFPHAGPMSPNGFGDARNEPFSSGRNQDYRNTLGLDVRRGGPGEGLAMKRKYGEQDERDDRDEIARQSYLSFQQGNPNGFPRGAGDHRSGFLAGTSSPHSRNGELRACKYMRMGGGGYDQNLGFRQGGGYGDSNVAAEKHLEVDQNALKKAFLHFVKIVNENAGQRKNYLEDGKHGRLHCVACGRSSKNFPDMQSLITHTYNPDSSDSLVDHLGLHKALCVLMGWSYSKPPDNSKAYQMLSANEAAANRDDLVVWPPLVIIHNTLTGKGKEGRMEGLGNKAMDSKIRDLGFGAGKSKSLYGREGHLGITLIKFSGDQMGLNESMRMADLFEKDNHGRMAWAQVQPIVLGKDDEKNPNLVKVDEKTGEKKRIFYGYLGTAADLDKVDFEMRKKVTIESRREYKPSNK